MSIVYQTVPISEIKNKPTDVIKMIEQNPVVLTQRGESTAVLSSVGAWNRLNTELSRLRRIIAADRAEQRADFVEFAYADTN